MTEQQQRAANAELARRMGWTVKIEGGKFNAAKKPSWYSPEGKYSPLGLPDYFNSPAASRELMVWLAKQDKDIQFDFIRIIDESIPDGTPYMIGILTTPLPVIARAACKALGLR